MAKRKKVVLITGGAGFIGSHLCDWFIDRGYSVMCMDNLITGSKDNIAHLLGYPHFKFIHHDVSKTIHVDGPVDFVLHFASPASPVDYLNYPIQTLKVGSLGTHNSLGLAKIKKAKYFLASTSEVYGDPTVHPQKESYWGHVNPVGPRGVYDEAKRFSEAMTMAYRRVHKLDTKIIRIFNTYGPRMRMLDGRVVPNFIYQVLHNKPLTVYGKGSQTRSFCYISDLVEGITRLLFSNHAGPMNMGNPQEFTILQFAHLVIELSEGSGSFPSSPHDQSGTTAKNTPTGQLSEAKAKIIYKPLPVDDPKQRRPDIGLARKTLRWKPKVELVDGLRETIEWFRDRISV